MTPGSWTFRELLTEVAPEDLRDEATAQAIRTCIVEQAPRGREFLPVHILAGLGAWFATGFFVGFAGMSGMFDDKMVLLFTGLILLGGSTFCSRMPIQEVFFRQALLAIALTGNALALVGLGQVAEPDFSAALTIGQLAICIVFYPISRSQAWRLLAPIGVALFAVIWMFEQGGHGGVHGRHAVQTVALHGIVAVEALLFGYLWLGKARPDALEPLAYAAALMLPATLVSVELAQIDDWGGLIEVRLWPSSLILGAGLLWTIGRISGRGSFRGSPDLWFFFGGVVLLSLMSAPGILVAIGLLTVGRWLGDRILMAIGYASLPVFLFTWYFSLEIDLGTKSWILMGSGLVLLALQQALRWIGRKEATT